MNYTPLTNNCRYYQEEMLLLWEYKVNGKVIIYFFAIKPYSETVQICSKWKNEQARRRSRIAFSHNIISIYFNLFVGKTTVWKKVRIDRLGSLKNLTRFEGSVILIKTFEFNVHGFGMLTLWVQLITRLRWRKKVAQNFCSPFRAYGLSDLSAENRALSTDFFFSITMCRN